MEATNSYFIRLSQRGKTTGLLHRLLKLAKFDGAIEAPPQLQFTKPMRLALLNPTAATATRVYC